MGVKQISCAACGGHGMYQAGFDITPTMCRECTYGNQWLYPNGTIAKYYGGPLRGRLTKEECEKIWKIE